MKPQYTKEAFRDWVTGQEPKSGYDYTDPMDCAWARYMQSVGVVCEVQPGSFRPMGMAAYVPLPVGVEDAVKLGPWTFGALAERLA